MNKYILSALLILSASASASAFALSPMAKCTTVACVNTTFVNHVNQRFMGVPNQWGIPIPGTVTIGLTSAQLSLMRMDYLHAAGSTKQLDSEIAYYGSPGLVAAWAIIVKNQKVRVPMKKSMWTPVGGTGSYLDYSIGEIYTDFLIEGQMSSAAAMIQTAEVLGYTASIEISTGALLGTAIYNVVEFVDPAINDSIGATVNDAIEGVIESGGADEMYPLDDF